MTDAILTDLAHQVRAASGSAEHQRRRKLWAQLHAQQPPRALVSCTVYTNVWERELAPAGCLRHEKGLARQIEVQLRARLWKAANIPDDDPLLPTVWLQTPHPHGDTRSWGVPIETHRTDASGGAYKEIAPLVDEKDFERLRMLPYEEDTAARQKLLDDARSLVGDLLPIKLHSDELHFGPFEWAVRLRGMDALLYDVYDRPGFVHKLMDFITTAMVGYHRAREAAGAVEAEGTWGWHMLYDDVPAGGERLLKNSWAYIHAQSAASYSPAMYAEFIQPYHVRLAEMVGKVYYHGCENLAGKCRTIKELPNLCLFHISPWTPVEPVVKCMGSKFSYEIHSHPANVLFAYTPEQIREELKRLHDQSQGAARQLKLCDVVTVGDQASRLRLWAETGREVVEA